jgi:hypothetical protein
MDKQHTGGTVRVLVGDELGYTRCVQSSTDNSIAFSVVARWGEGTRATGVERLSIAHGAAEGHVSNWVAGACQRGVL